MELHVAPCPNSLTTCLLPFSNTEDMYKQKLKGIEVSPCVSISANVRHEVEKNEQQQHQIRLNLALLSKAWAWALAI